MLVGEVRPVLAAEAKPLAIGLQWGSLADAKKSHKDSIATAML